MSNFKVTAVDVNYAQTLTDLARRIFFDAFSHETTPENIQAHLDRVYTLKAQTEELNSPYMHSFMAFDGEKPIGFFQLRQKEDVYDFIGDKEAIELQRIYVDKEYAGKGVGRLLLETSIAKARELNKKTIWLGVADFNLSATKFYERNGFYKVGTHIFKFGEQIKIDNVMIKKL